PKHSPPAGPPAAAALPRYGPAQAVPHSVPLDPQAPSGSQPASPPTVPAPATQLPTAVTHRPTVRTAMLRATGASPGSYARRTRPQQAACAINPQRPARLQDPKPPIGETVRRSDARSAPKPQAPHATCPDSTTPWPGRPAEMQHTRQ